jgi:hypothetical protein
MWRVRGKIGLEYRRRFWEEDEDIMGAIATTKKIDGDPYETELDQSSSVAWHRTRVLATAGGPA